MNQYERWLPIPVITNPFADDAPTTTPSIMEDLVKALEPLLAEGEALGDHALKVLDGYADTPGYIADLSITYHLGVNLAIAIDRATASKWDGGLAIKDVETTAHYMTATAKHFHS